MILQAHNWKLSSSFFFRMGRHGYDFLLKGTVTFVGYFPELPQLSTSTENWTVKVTDQCTEGP